MSHTDAFTAFKDRPAPAPGLRVRVYRNLNRPSLFSIVALEGTHKGKVLGYAPVVGLTAVVFKVSEVTRQSVLRKQVRTVHAFAEGALAGMREQLPDACQSPQARQITYQPFIAGHFFDRKAPDTPVTKLPEVWSCQANLVAPAP